MNVTINEEIVQPVRALKNIFICNTQTFGDSEWYYVHATKVFVYQKNFFYVDNCTQNMKKMRNKTADHFNGKKLIYYLNFPT